MRRKKTKIVIITIVVVLVVIGVLLMRPCNSNVEKEKSIFYNPKEEYLLKKIATVDSITNLKSVTEDNDPNKQLHKQGGYTSMIYFESSLVDQKLFDTDDVIRKGTDCGGSIEVYENEADAIKRDKYLSSFDGTILSSGRHEVIGTIIIRISNELPAAKQEELTRKIKEAISNTD